MKTEHIAEESGGPGVSWTKAVRHSSFLALLSTKRRFLVPAVIVYVVFYIGLTSLAGFAKGFMVQKVVGQMNVGYALIIATYAMAWIVAMVYVRVANRTFDPLTEAAVASLQEQRKKA